MLSLRTFGKSDDSINSLFLIRTTDKMEGCGGRFYNKKMEHTNAHMCRTNFLLHLSSWIPCPPLAHAHTKERGQSHSRVGNVTFFWSFSCLFNLYPPERNFGKKSALFKNTIPGFFYIYFLFYRKKCSPEQKKRFNQFWFFGFFFCFLNLIWVLSQI